MLSLSLPFVLKTDAAELGNQVTYLSEMPEYHEKACVETPTVPPLYMYTYMHICIQYK